MKQFDSNRVINGTFGELWIDGQQMAQTTKLEAKIEMDYEDVNKSGSLATYKKMTSYSGSGSITLNHVSSYFIDKLSENTKAGKMTVCTIISKLQDPDAFGCERIQLSGVVFDDITLANWEAKSIGEEEVPFTFTDWKVLDKIADN